MNSSPKLATREAEAPGTTRSLVIRRTLPASPERVFAAWTRAEILSRWFGPGEVTVEEAEVEARLGGRYRIVMRTPQGDLHSPGGVYEEVVPNERLVFTWKWADADLVTRVTVVLRPSGEGATELELTHEGFPDDEMRDRHDEGWAGCLDKLPGALRRMAETETAS